METMRLRYDFVYDYAGRLIENEMEPANTADLGRIYWGNAMLAYRGQDANTYFEHEDWLGTTRLRTDSQGNVAATYNSLPFGDGTTSTINETDGGQESPYFAGLPQDSFDGDTDTNHAQYRQYYNTLGNWLSPDPYSGSYDFTNPQSMNRYSYVLNNPLAYIDPDGTTGCDDGDPSCDPDCGCGGSSCGGSGDQGGIDQECANGCVDQNGNVWFPAGEGIGEWYQTAGVNYNPNGSSCDMNDDTCSYFYSTVAPPMMASAPYFPGLCIC